MSNKLWELWKRYDHTIIIILALLMTGLVGFQMGRNYQKTSTSEQMNIRFAGSTSCPKSDSKSTAQTSPNAKIQAGEKTSVGSSDPSSSTGSTNTSAAAQPGQCAFVGSKSSNKYHLPDCRYAARINDGNKICFSSEEEAKSQGYQRAKCCDK